MKWAAFKFFWAGAVGVVPLLGVATQVLDGFTVPDIAAGIHAALLGWNVLMGAIGSFIGSMVGFENVSPVIVNALLIGCTIGPAWSYSILIEEWGQHKGGVQNTAFWTRAIIGFADTFLMSLFLVSAPFGSVIFYIALVALLIPFAAVLRRLAFYRRGLLLTLGALVAVEVIYLLNQDTVGASFDRFVCEQQQVDAPRCSQSEAP